MDKKFEYALRYFELHAGQRMSTFNFFIVLSGLLTTAFVSTFRKDFAYPSLGYVIAIAIIWVSVIFWKLDQRIRFLIKHAEESLRLLENNEDCSFPKLFAQESDKTKSKNREPWQGVFKEHMSYSQCFSNIYLLVAIVGFLGFLATLYIQIP